MRLALSYLSVILSLIGLICPLHGQTLTETVEFDPPKPTVEGVSAHDETFLMEKLLPNLPPPGKGLFRRKIDPANIDAQTVLDLARMSVAREQAQKMAKQKEAQKLEGWIFDGLRLLRQQRGQQLSKTLQLMEQESVGSASNDESDDVIDNLYAIRERRNSRNMEANSSIQLSSLTLDRMSMAERVRYKRQRLDSERVKQGEDLTQKSNSGFGLWSFDPVDGDGNSLKSDRARDETMTRNERQLEYLASYSNPAVETFGIGKESFGPGQLQWFERPDDALPVAGPSGADPALTRGLLRGQTSLYSRPTSFNNDGLADGAFNPFENSSGNAQDEILELRRPGVEVPLEQYLKEQTVKIRQAQPVAPEAIDNPQQNRRMTPTSSGRRTGNRIADPWDYYGPNGPRRGINNRR